MASLGGGESQGANASRTWASNLSAGRWRSPSVRGAASRRPGEGFVSQPAFGRDFGTTLEQERRRRLQRSGSDSADVGPCSGTSPVLAGVEESKHSRHSGAEREDGDSERAVGAAAGGLGVQASAPAPAAEEGKAPAGGSSLGQNEAGPTKEPNLPLSAVLELLRSVAQGDATARAPLSGSDDGRSRTVRRRKKPSSVRRRRRVAPGDGAEGGQVMLPGHWTSDTDDVRFPRRVRRYAASSSPAAQEGSTSDFQHAARQAQRALGAAAAAATPPPATARTGGRSTRGRGAGQQPAAAAAAPVRERKHRADVFSSPDATRRAHARAAEQASRVMESVSQAARRTLLPPVWSSSDGGGSLLAALEDATARSGAPEARRVHTATQYDTGHAEAEDAPAAAVASGSRPNPDGSDAVAGDGAGEAASPGGGTVGPQAAEPGHDAPEARAASHTGPDEVQEAPAAGTSAADGPSNAETGGHVAAQPQHPGSAGAGSPAQHSQAPRADENDGSRQRSSQGGVMGEASTEGGTPAGSAQSRPAHSEGETASRADAAGCRRAPDREDAPRGEEAASQHGGVAPPRAGDAHASGAGPAPAPPSEAPEPADGAAPATLSPPRTHQPRTPQSPEAHRAAEIAGGSAPLPHEEDDDEGRGNGRPGDETGHDALGLLTDAEGWLSSIVVEHGGGEESKGGETSGAEHEVEVKHKYDEEEEEEEEEGREEPAPSFQRVLTPRWRARAAPTAAPYEQCATALFSAIQAARRHAARPATLCLPAPPTPTPLPRPQRSPLLEAPDRPRPWSPAAPEQKEGAAAGPPEAAAASDGGGDDFAVPPAQAAMAESGRFAALHGSEPRPAETRDAAVQFSATSAAVQVSMEGPDAETKGEEGHSSEHAAQPSRQGHSDYPFLRSAAGASAARALSATHSMVAALRGSWDQWERERRLRHAETQTRGPSELPVPPPPPPARATRRLGTHAKAMVQLQRAGEGRYSGVAATMGGGDEEGATAPDTDDTSAPRRPTPVGVESGRPALRAGDVVRWAGVHSEAHRATPGSPASSESRAPSTVPAASHRMGAARPHRGASDGAWHGVGDGRPLREDRPHVRFSAVPQGAAPPTLGPTAFAGPIASAGASAPAPWHRPAAKTVDAAAGPSPPPLEVQLRTRFAPGAERSLSSLPGSTVGTESSGAVASDASWGDAGGSAEGAGEQRQGAWLWAAQRSSSESVGPASSLASTGQRLVGFGESTATMTRGELERSSQHEGATADTLSTSGSSSQSAAGALPTPSSSEAGEESQLHSSSTSVAQWASSGEWGAESSSASSAAAAAGLWEQSTLHTSTASQEPSSGGGDARRASASQSTHTSAQSGHRDVLSRGERALRAAQRLLQSSGGSSSESNTSTSTSTGVAGGSGGSRPEAWRREGWSAEAGGSSSRDTSQEGIEGSVYVTPAEAAGWSQPRSGRLGANAPARSSASGSRRGGGRKTASDGGRRPPPDCAAWADESRARSEELRLPLMPCQRGTAAERQEHAAAQRQESERMRTVARTQRVAHSVQKAVQAWAVDSGGGGEPGPARPAPQRPPWRPIADRGPRASSVLDASPVIAAGGGSGSRARAAKAPPAPRAYGMYAPPERRGAPAPAREARYAPQAALSRTGHGDSGPLVRAEGSRQLGYGRDEERNSPAGSAQWGDEAARSEWRAAALAPQSKAWGAGVEEAAARSSRPRRSQHRAPPDEARSVGDGDSVPSAADRGDDGLTIDPQDMAPRPQPRRAARQRDIYGTPSWWPTSAPHEDAPVEPAAAAAAAAVRERRSQLAAHQRVGSASPPLPTEREQASGAGVALAGAARDWRADHRLGVRAIRQDRAFGLPQATEDIVWVDKASGDKLRLGEDGEVQRWDAEARQWRDADGLGAGHSEPESPSSSSPFGSPAMVGASEPSSQGGEEVPATSEAPAPEPSARETAQRADGAQSAATTVRRASAVAPSSGEQSVFSAAAPPPQVMAQFPAPYTTTPGPFPGYMVPFLPPWQAQAAWWGAQPVMGPAPPQLAQQAVTPAPAVAQTQPSVQVGAGATGGAQAGTVASVPQPVQPSVAAQGPQPAARADSPPAAVASTVRAQSPHPPLSGSVRSRGSASSTRSASKPAAESTQAAQNDERARPALKRARSSPALAQSQAVASSAPGARRWLQEFTASAGRGTTHAGMPTSPARSDAVGGAAQGSGLTHGGVGAGSERAFGRPGGSPRVGAEAGGGWARAAVATPTALRSFRTTHDVPLSASQGAGSDAPEQAGRAVASGATPLEKRMADMLDEIRAKRAARASREPDASK